MRYLGNTFSPMMMGEKLFVVEVCEINLDDIPPNLTSVVSHEVTAKVLSVLLDESVVFNRVNLALKQDDVLYCVIPNFRATKAREFTKKEVEKAGYRCFMVQRSI